MWRPARGSAGRHGIAGIAKEAGLPAGDLHRGIRLPGVEDVRRKDDRRHLAVVNPIMAQAIGLAADVAGLVVDRNGTIGAVLGDRAAQRIDESGTILVAV